MLDNDVISPSCGRVGNDNLYTPSTGTWTATTRDPIFAHVPLALLPNGDVWAAGSIQGDSIYNPSTAQWTNFAPPPCKTSKQSCESAGALLNTGQVLVAGGETYDKSLGHLVQIASAELYTP